LEIASIANVHLSSRHRSIAPKLPPSLRLPGPIMWARPGLPATARDCGRRRLPGPGRSLDLSNTCRIYSNALIFANAFAIWAITILTGAHRSAEPTTNKHTPPVI